MLVPVILAQRGSTAGGVYFFLYPCYFFLPCVSAVAEPAEVSEVSVFSLRIYYQSLWNCDKLLRKSDRFLWNSAELHRKGVILYGKGLNLPGRGFVLYGIVPAFYGIASNLYRIASNFYREASNLYEFIINLYGRVIFPESFCVILTNNIYNLREFEGILTNQTI
jgi:hypothetical protein